MSSVRLLCQNTNICLSLNLSTLHKILKYYFIILKFALQYMKSVEWIFNIYEVVLIFAGVVDS